MDTKMMVALFLAVVVPQPVLAQQTPATTHDCVVIVFDDSGSMNEPFGGGRRMDAAKRGLQVVLRGVPKTTWVGLLALNAGWQYQLGPNDATKMSAVIDRIDTSGGTPLARNIKIGADRLMAERQQQLGYGDYRLLVVTDGEEQENQELIEQYPPEVRARGLTLDVIGVGIGQNHALRKFAHTFRGADNPSQLEQALREVLAERVDPNDHGQDGTDAYALIAGLDPGVAQAMLVALGKLPNYQIGEQPAAAPAQGNGAPVGNGGGSGGYSPSPPGACGCQTGADARPPFGTFATIALLGLLRGHRHSHRRRARIARARSRVR